MTLRADCEISRHHERDVCTCPSRMATLVALAGPLVVSTPVAADESKFALARHRMIGDIERTQREVAHEAGSRTLDRKVLAVMGAVPRHLFVPRGQQESAYENRPLPIGHGQTISQPYIVALMTDLRVRGGMRNGLSFRHTVIPWPRPSPSRSTSRGGCTKRSATAGGCTSHVLMAAPAIRGLRLYGFTSRGGPHAVVYRVARSAPL